MKTRWYELRVRNLKTGAVEVKHKDVFWEALIPTAKCYITGGHQVQIIQVTEREIDLDSLVL